MIQQNCMVPAIHTSSTHLPGLLKFITASLFVLMLGCRKDFLDTLPSSSVAVPSTLTDYQAILDNDAVMDGTPVLGELSADNFYLTDPFWQSLDAREHNAYI